MGSRLNVQDAIYWFEANRAMLDIAAMLSPVHQLGEEAKASWRHDNAMKVQMYSTALAALRRVQEEEIIHE